MKVIIAGGRDFNDYGLLKKECDRILKEKKDITVVSGNANGADKLGEDYAREKGYRLRIYPANWGDIKDRPEHEIKTNKHGRKYWTGAGPHRNCTMAAYSDVLIAFWDGKSRGTGHMVQKAMEYKLETYIIEYKKKHGA